MAKAPSTRKPIRRPRPKARQVGLWGKDTLTIDRMSREGRGIASRAGKIVFVSGALPREQVRVQCTAVKRDYDEADLIELIPGTEPCAERVAPECAVYESCGGCSLQHWSLPAQQQHKQATLLTMLQSITPALVLDPTIAGRAYGFRHRLRLQVTRRSDRSYSLGLRQRQSHSAVSLQHCLVANAAVNALLPVLPDLLSGAPDLQGLRELEIDADSDGKLGLCFYFAAHPGEQVLLALHTAVLRNPVVALRVRLILQRASHSDIPDDTTGNDVAHWQELYAQGELCLRAGAPTDENGITGAQLLLSYLPGDFTQTHWDANMALVNRALDWLRPTAEEVALDLFSGIGNFSLPLALRARNVCALEGDSGMTLRLRANAERNGIENITAITRNLMADKVVLPRADIAIIDPPRAGAKAACEALARATVKRLVYVSCHPATLVRDARTLTGAGFALSKAAAVDMFPHTGHSEAIALFERK